VNIYLIFKLVQDKSLNIVSFCGALGQSRQTPCKHCHVYTLCMCLQLYQLIRIIININVYKYINERSYLWLARLSCCLCVFCEGTGSSRCSRLTLNFDWEWLWGQLSWAILRYFARIHLHYVLGNWWKFPDRCHHRRAMNLLSTLRKWNLVSEIMQVRRETCYRLHFSIYGVVILWDLESSWLVAVSMETFYSLR
jgi:hypothetical protein